MIVLLMAAPFLLAQALSPRRAILRPTPGAILLVVVAVLLQFVAAIEPYVAGVFVPSAFALGAVAITSVAWTSTKRRLPAFLAGFGSVANLIPIAIYGSMPVVRSSRLLVSDVALSEPDLLSAKHAEIDLDLGLAQPASLLSDWIPIPVVTGVISVGDLFLVAAFISIGVSARADQRAQPAPKAMNSETDGSLDTISA